MHHGSFERASDAGEALAGSDLSLLFVTGLDGGAPVLAGIEGDRQVVSLAPVSEADVGKLAACRFASAGSQALVVVLGYVALKSETLVALMTAVATSDAPAPRSLRLGCGRSELRLEPDGRILLIGDDVTLRARKQMHVRGATIDLN